MTERKTERKMPEVEIVFDGYLLTDRLRVPGGWLYRTTTGVYGLDRGVSTTFVPDQFYSGIDSSYV